MQSAKPTILCTGPIEESAVELPEYKDANIDVVPFTTIKFELSDTAEEQLKELLKKKAVVVFTSNNAVKSIAGYLENSQPDWKIFCIGNTTRTLAKKYFGEDRIMQSASTAAELAEKIIADVEEREVIFFCGNLRRNDLPDAVRQKGITIKEITVYQTNFSPIAVEKEYDAVLFFSPSAAESFFSKNSLPVKTVLFVIGNTTAESIRKYSSNKIITGDEPDKNKLISKTIRFFKANTLHR
jgi:uroporphyrinogen-III synthase